MAAPNIYFYCKANASSLVILLFTQVEPEVFLNRIFLYSTVFTFHHQPDQPTKFLRLSYILLISKNVWKVLRKLN